MKPTSFDEDQEHCAQKWRVVDLFCGCGGLSRGLERTGRFVTTFGVDNNRAALETFINNHGSPQCRPVGHLGDIRELQPDALWKALSRYGVSEPGQLECLVGGPPCEGFSRNKVYTHNGSDVDHDHGITSVAPVEYAEPKYWKSAWSAAPLEGAPQGQRVVRAYNPFLNDPRNFLFRAFLDIAEYLQPKIVLIENVKQILSHAGGSIAEEIKQRLDVLGYRAEARVLNAAEFGVPQMRQRAFFVAIRKDLVAKAATELPWPRPTHRQDRPDNYQERVYGDTEFPGDRGAFVSVAEALGDLPPARPNKEDSPRMPPSAYPDAAISAFRRFVRSEMATPANHVYRTPSEQVLRRLRAMRPGMRPHDLPSELQTKKYYYNAYGRLEWDRPANTITKSFLYPGSGKFAHPVQDRVISYREAARLQSFDDDFTFMASSQEGLASMIGSAVPPLLGYFFGVRFAEFLESLG